MVTFAAGGVFFLFRLTSGGSLFQQQENDNQHQKAKQDFGYFVDLVESVHRYFADAEQRGADEPLH